MSAPVTKGWLVRPRLLERLDASTPIVVVTGPTGAGVTTLLHQWQASTDGALGLEGAVDEQDDRLNSATALVLDDADRLHEEDWAVLNRLRRDRPSLRLRIGVRSPLVLPSHWDADVVRDLLFTPAELLELLATRGSTAEARAVHLTTAGFPAAVAAILGSGVTRAERFRAVLAEAGGACLPAEEAVLAVPELLTHALVRDLVGAIDFLERAERAGHGAWTPGGQGRVFMLSPLVRASTRARHPLPSARRRFARSSAAEALLAEEAWLEAIAEGRRAERLDVVDAALRRGGMPLLTEHGRQLRWELERIPLLQLRRWPIIAMAAALIANARHQHAVRASQLMGIAILGAASSAPGSPNRALLRLIESVARRVSNVGDGGVKAAATAIAMLDDMSLAELEELDSLLGDIRVHCAISLLYGGRIDEAREQFEHAAATPSRVGVELMAVGGAALTHAVEGDVAGALRWIEIAEQRPWPTRILDEYAGSMLRISQSLVAIERGELEEAEAYLSTIMPIIDTIEHWPLLAYARAIIDVRRGDAQHGLERLRLLRARRGRRLPAEGTSARLLDLAASTLALAAGDMTEASALQQRAADAPAFVALGVARVAVFAGDDGLALRRLRAIEPRTPVDRLHHMLLHAIVLRRGGQVQEAAVLARRAGALARATGLTTPLALLPADERDLFEEEAPPAPAGLAPLGAVPQLTERERIVLHELLRTSRIDEIAARLHVSANTVKSQRRSLYRKLEASSRDEALARAAALGLIGEPGSTGHAP